MMATGLAQSHSPYPGGMQQHPGVPQGHQMAGMPHNPGQQMPGQPGMNPQMHMVSGPGPQVSQAGALMGGMPPGAGVPSAHALQHLNPAQNQQAQLYQQQMAFANNPQLQQMQQQQMIQQHRQQQAARQALMAQQYSGVMPGGGMPNGMNQMTPAQYAAMRSGPMARPVNLPQHLQHAQAQAQHSLEQQQAQQQHQQQQQHIMQQLAMQQQQANAHAQAQAGNNQGQQSQMNSQQLQNMQQAQMAAQQQAQAQAQAAAAAQQQNQAQSQSQAQPQPQQSQPNPQAPNQQAQQQAQQQPNLQQQQAAAMAAMSQQQQQRQGEKLKGQCLMRLMQFGDHLSSFGVSSKPLSVYIERGAQRQAAQANKQRDDLSYWVRFVDQFFSSKGVLRHGVWIDGEESNKQYEIPFHALARYFHTHFESGIKNMQMIMERGSEKELPNNGHYIESQKSSFVYWFDSGAQLIANGTLKAHFDAEQKIELFEFSTSSHDEYLPRSKVIDAARPFHDWSKEWKTLNALPDGKQSPEMNKKKAKAMKSPQQPPPEIDLPLSKVKQSMGITPSVFRFLELAEVLGQMNPLFNYAHQNANLAPYAALDQYVTTQTVNGTNPTAQQNPSGPRTPGMSNFVGASPAAAHLQLPDGSPHVSGSPAQAQAMQLQQSQHGTSSSGPSANTSPNVNNKRRRGSAIKTEEENQVNGTGQSKAVVKPSPRIGGKRQKGNPA